MIYTRSHPISIIFFLAFLLLFSCAERKKIIPGTSLELARERKSTISNLRYDLLFDIPAARQDSIPARVTLTLSLHKPTSALLLDFNAPSKNLLALQVNDHAVTIRHENEHILIDQDHLIEGTNSITIDFVAGDAALNRNEDYLYTLFVPSRASSCFPSFDQPDLKATYNLELNVPLNWHALANGKAISIDSSKSKKHYRFSLTKPTSTYQFAFAAGNFRKATDPLSRMNMYYRETDSAKVAKNIDKIFELHRSSLAWLKKYTGIDYPYEKFDFALMPSFQFGGMEHPGSIFYRESSLFLDPSASVNEELRRASLIAHETAHMWFGNLVTMQWFNDVWMKEVFANFMAAKMVSPDFPEINHDLRFLMAHYPSAYDVDRSSGTHPIQQPLDNLKNAGSVYGAIIYQKAPIMMRNLESWIGPENFQHGLQDYLIAYSYQNATWDDLVNILKKYTDKDLDVWNTAWIKTAGMPEIDVTPAADGKSFLTIVNDSIGTIWPQSFQYKISSNYFDRVQDIAIRNARPTLLTKWVAPDVRFIPNFKGRGYGYFHASPEHLIGIVNKQEDAEVRAGIWITLWEIFLRGQLDPPLLLEKILTAVKEEKDPLLLEYLTDKINRIYWQFLTPGQRSLVSKDLDDTLFELMALEKDNSRKRTIFNCYRSVANSPKGVLNLIKFWSDEISLGLEVSERDHIQLAYALAIREAEGHENILAAQLNKVTNPDRKSEMQFVLQALSPDPAVRDRFFESLAKKENRTREPWVLEAVRYLHHPLRAEYSKRYLKTSLQMLEEVQSTGDIFFPKGWLDATLGDYQSASAADVVRGYLNENAGLRPDLRNKLLQSADMLFRAELITKKNLAASPN